MRNPRLAGLLAILVLLAGCFGNSESAKKRNLENGDRYLKQGKLREASIIYRNILKKDPKYGPAYARLGEVELKRGQPPAAVRALLRAVELLPKDEEVAGKLADIYLVAYSANRAQNKKLLDDVIALRDTLRKNDPNSYHGARLAGFVEVALGNLAKAEDEFRKADRIKPKQPELRFALTQVLVQQSKWEECEQITKQIMEDSPNYQPAYDFLMLNYLRRDRRSEAEVILKKKAERFTEKPDAAIQLAAFYYATQRVPEAEKWLDQVLANSAKWPEGRIRVGDFYMRLQKPDQALKIYQEGIAKDPEKKTQYRLKQAAVYAALRRMDEAVKVVDLAVSEDSKNNDALSMRAALMLASGDPAKVDGAIADLQQLLGKTPENLVVRYNLARAYHGKNELDAARVQYQEAIKIRRDFIGAHLGLGQVLLAKRDWGKAIQTADEIFRYSPNNLGAQVIKVNAIMNSGNVRQARTELTNFLQQHPDSPDLQFQSALIYLAEKEYAQAEKLLLPLRNQFPNDARVLYSLAEIYLSTNRQNDAVRMLQAEAARNPARVDVKTALGNATIRSNQYDLAEAEFRKLIEIEPKNPTHYLKLGEIVRRKGNQEAALGFIRKAQEIAPTDPTANLQLALMLESSGRRDECKPFYENVLKQQPDHPIALNNLAFMLAEEGLNLDTALTYAQRARMQMPQNADVADTIAWIYLKKQLNDQALNIYKDLVTKNPNNALYHYHMGVAYFQKGDKATARKSLQTALSLRPDRQSEAKIRELLTKLG